MLNVESLQVAEEEVVESSSNKLCDIYTFVAKGCFPQTMNSLRKKNLKRYAQKFIIDEDKLYYVGTRKEEKREVVIEADRRRQIFLDCHFDELGHHLGQKKTVHRIQRRYYWLGIIRDVVDWIKVCETCRRAERTKNLARTARPLKVEAPWEIVGIDFLGPFPESQQGNASVALLIDYFSKWPEAFPVRRTDALSVARCVSKCIYRFGAPKTVVCAQSVDFCEEVTRLLRDRWKVDQKVAPRRRAQLDPLHDCTGPRLKAAVAQMVAERQADWDDFLDPVLFLVRTAVNPTTKFSPYSLMFNRKAPFPSETTSNVLDYAEQPDVFSTKEQASRCMSVIEEQQDSVKQLVLANMNAAYKQEKKKNSRRRSHNVAPLGLKVPDPLLAAEDSPSPKKLKGNLFLSFPDETVLSSGQSGASGIKAELPYHLDEPDLP